MHEKRIHPRVTSHIPIACELEAGGRVEGSAEDISMGGMFIQATEAPPFGKKIVVVCTLQQGGPELRLDAIVRWGKPGGFGVQFGLLGARETHALATAVKSRG